MDIRLGSDLGYLSFLDRLICEITNRSITVNVIRQFPNPSPFTLQTKRNPHSAAEPKGKRLALPLDLKDLPEDGARVLKQYERGLIKLTTRICNAKEYKDCVTRSVST